MFAHQVIPVIVGAADYGHLVVVEMLPLLEVRNSGMKCDGTEFWRYRNR
jgi:hypothetical protein